VAIAIFVFGAIKSLIPLFSFLIIALFLGVALHQIVFWFNQHKIPKGVSQTTLALFLFAFGYFLFGVLVPSIVNQITGFAQHVPEYRSHLEQSIESTGVRNFVHTHLEEVPENINSIPEKAMSVGGFTINVIYEFLVVMILSIYLMMDGEKAYRAILNLFKKYGSVETEQKVKKTANEIRNVIFAFAKGQLITCTFVAIFSYIANRLLHIPGALTLAAIASVCDLIPVVGFISSLSIAVLVGFTVSPWPISLLLTPGFSRTDPRRVVG
jgi:predicted PurR-regulated permease PerM